VNLDVATRSWYQTYYQRAGADRNNLHSNRGVLFQTLALEASVVRASYSIAHNPAAATVLDVGCGGGSELYQLLRLKYDPANIVGIDILPERIDGARILYPQAKFVVGDACAMPFNSESFDLVFESTMFATLPDEQVSMGIAREMLRVCRPHGYLLLVDWRTPKPWDTAHYKALTRSRLSGLFSVGSQTRIVGTYRGALVPPVGRFLSKHMGGGYFLLAETCPFLVGQVAYLLVKSL
jgi:ubiquinone/menaquinone biosynthesis C-methylase UbiE